MLRMGQWLRRLIVSRAVRRADDDNRVLAAEVTALRHSLEEERVKNRILQSEVELLAAVHARDLARWQSDTPAVREGQ